MINLSDLQNFPKDFKFGVATSSYQIEGNNYGDCGKSIWDDFAKRKLSGIDGKNACNHIKYFKYEIFFDSNFRNVCRSLFILAWNSNFKKLEMF